MSRATSPKAGIPTLRFWRALALALIWASFPVEAARAQWDWSNPRALPSLVTEWRLEGEACDVVVEGTSVLVLKQSGLVALDGRTGALLWEQPAARGPCGYRQEALHVVEDSVVAAQGEQIFLVDLGSGVLRGVVKAPERVERIWGHAAQYVIVQTSAEDDGKELLSLDSRGRAVAAQQRFAGFVVALVLRDDLVMVAAGHGSKYAVHALRVPDLSELWRLDGFTGVERIGAAVYVEKAAESEETSVHDFVRVDPRTGALGERLPRREPADSVYSDRLPWELDIVRRNGYWLRRNSLERGKPVWSTELPGYPAGRTLHNGKLYLPLLCRWPRFPRRAGLGDGRHR